MIDFRKNCKYGVKNVNTALVVHWRFYFSVTSLTEVLTLEEQLSSLQMELCDLQADCFMRGKRHLDSQEFCRLV